MVVAERPDAGPPQHVGEGQRDRRRRARRPRRRRRRPRGPGRRAPRRATASPASSRCDRGARRRQPQQRAVAGGVAPRRERELAQPVADAQPVERRWLSQPMIASRCASPKPRGRSAASATIASDASPARTRRPPPARGGEAAARVPAGLADLDDLDAPSEDLRERPGRGGERPPTVGPGRRAARRAAPAARSPPPADGDGAVIVAPGPLRAGSPPPCARRARPGRRRAPCRGRGAAGRRRRRS